MTKHLFQPGNPGGPGRPRRQTELAYMIELMGAVPLDTWRQITERAVTDALNGDKDARNWLSKYLVGTPSNPAPTPLQAAVEALLQRDRALDKAVEIRATKEMGADLDKLLNFDSDEKTQQRIRAELLATEAHG